MAKRISIFLVVNLLVILTITIILNIFGIGNYITAMGMNYSGLFLFCIVWGVGGSLISLMISKWMAKHLMGVQIVSIVGPHKNLVDTVHRLSRRAGLTTMPEVGIYQSSELNAFATGPSRNNSLVAVSSTLLFAMTEDEIEGVLAHEVSHIANGDMVTLTLIQGILNAFVMFFARVVAFMIDQQLKKEDKESEGLGPIAYTVVVILLQILFGIFASIIVNWFSRYREFKADLGGANLATKAKMISALECLNRNFSSTNENEENINQKNFRSMQISSKNGFMFLFSTHPPLRDRILALKNS